MTVRVCTEDDLPWAVALAKTCYGDLIDDEQSCYVSAKQRIDSPKAVMLRTEGAVLIAFVGSHFFSPSKPFGVIEIFFGNPLQFRSLFKSARDWFKERGINKAAIGIITEHDFSGFMQQIGARVRTPSYEWEF